jgi:transcriptional regulator with XRE-family HTH domain
VRYPTEIDIAKRLGARIIQLRKESNISQVDLCYDAGIDISTLSRIERGNLNPTLHTLYKIAKYFNLEIRELF